MKNIKVYIQKSMQKNLPEIKTFLKGDMPPFITRFGNDPTLDLIPTFVFHEVEPEAFNNQLYYLKSNGYQTVDAGELESAIKNRIFGDRIVALTFDDATWTFWAYAFPILKRYNYKALLFVIPGLISEDKTDYPNIDDYSEGKCSIEEIKIRGKVQPLCTWRELITMNQSGLVDIQSHSLTHSLVPITGKVIDFQHPRYDTYIFGNINIPISSLDNTEKPERDLRLGAPIFQSAPRLAGKLRFIDNEEIVINILEYVQKHGGSSFFNHKNWRKKLYGRLKTLPNEKFGRFESYEDMIELISKEFIESKKIIEEKISGKKVQHFCYPWFIGSKIADRIAEKTGYRTLHYGLTDNPSVNIRDKRILKIYRISEEYLLRLPGNQRKSLPSIWGKRLRLFIKGPKGKIPIEMLNTRN